MSASLAVMLPAIWANPVASLPDAPLLLGKIRHCDHLEPVPPEARSGVYEQGMSQYRQIPGNIWFRIPYWLAGPWSNKEGTETLTYDKDLRRHQQSASVSDWKVDSTSHLWGCQTDNTGQVWHFAGVPYTSSTHLLVRGQTSYSTVYELTPVASANNQFVVRYRCHVVVVDDCKKTVLRTYGCEEIQSINLIDGRLLTESDMALYDETGRKYREHKVVRFLERDGAFAPKDRSSAGQDLAMLFGQYLISQGLSNLQPDEMAADTAKKQANSSLEAGRIEEAESQLCAARDLYARCKTNNVFERSNEVFDQLIDVQFKLKKPAEAAASAMVQGQLWDDRYASDNEECVSKKVKIAQRFVGHEQYILPFLKQLQVVLGKLGSVHDEDLCQVSAMLSAARLPKDRREPH